MTDPLIIQSLATKHVYFESIIFSNIPRVKPTNSELLTEQTDDLKLTAIARIPNIDPLSEEFLNTCNQTVQILLDIVDYIGHMEVSSDTQAKLTKVIKTLYK